MENTIRGFRLYELVVVVLIIGIMAALATPRYAVSLQRFRAESAAKGNMLRKGYFLINGDIDIANSLLKNDTTFFNDIVIPLMRPEAGTAKWEAES